MPTYPDPFIRHSMLWSLPDGEVASCNVSWASTDGFLSIGDDVRDLLANKADIFWSAIKSEYANEVAFVGSRLQLISVSGHVVETREVLGDPISGTAGSNPLPTEVAIVVSLNTADGSRSGRGRFYMPNMSIGTVSSVGRLVGGVASDLVAAAATYLESSADPAIYSVVASGIGAGHLRPVVLARVGDVFDVQRRRRDAIAEVRYTAAVT